jgi:hypothetical protein
VIKVEDCTFGLRTTAVLAPEVVSAQNAEPKLRWYGLSRRSGRFWLWLAVEFRLKARAGALVALGAEKPTGAVPVSVGSQEENMAGAPKGGVRIVKGNGSDLLQRCGADRLRGLEGRSVE